MSKLFNDPIYKDLASSDEGWLELAIEPYRFKLNDDIAALPEEVVLSYELLSKHIHNEHSARYGIRVNKGVFVEDLFERTHGYELDYFTSDHAVRCFELECSPNTTIDLKNETVNGEIKLVKVRNCIPDDNVPRVICDIAMCKINMRTIRGDDPADFSARISRANEILDIIGTTDGRSSRSLKKKLVAVRKNVRTILLEDQWRIRSADLIFSFAEWITDYCKNGNQHALMNLTRLKCMTHKGHPIYSMEEIA